MASSNLEQAWRPFIPVDSFVREPVEPKPEVVKPDVGIRWGKPADFEFNVELPKKQENKWHPLHIIYTNRYYFKNEIEDFTEVWREYRKGQVTVFPEKIEDDKSSWEKYLEKVEAHSNNESEEEEPLPKVELEEIRSWIVDSGITWTHYDRNGDPDANVTVYYQFEIDTYTPFNRYPKKKYGERGEKPEGIP